jgi:hypothetical protein
MIRHGHIFGGILICALGMAGCESIALMPRPDIDDRSDTVTRGRYDRDRSLANELVGTVERVDPSAREIHLRTTEGRMTALKYDPRTIVSHRGRDLRVEDLRRGDFVLVEVSRDGRGDDHAELIRMNDRPG